MHNRDTMDKKWDVYGRISNMENADADGVILPHTSSCSYMNRRTVIRGAALSLGAALLEPAAALADCIAAGTVFMEYVPDDQRTLSFYSPNTKEHLTVTYYKDGKYVRSALSKVNLHFRDHYCGRVHMIDPELLDYLYKLKSATNLSVPFHILSAYRTPATNNMLRRHSSKVAKHSYHICGRAVDIRVPGVRTSTLRRAAYRLRMGGVGYYKRARFVHLDTGQFRAWWG